MRYISISGAVGAGKTTLTGRLLQLFGPAAAAREEQPEHNPFIRSYYADSRRWSFHSQIAFLGLYFEDMSWRQPDREYYFFDRCLEENLVLARYRLEAGDLSADEFGVIERLARGIASLMPPIDRYIYLRCSPELLCRRLRERGRAYEQQLGLAYAQRLSALYEAWAAELPKDRTLIVDEDDGVDLDAVLRFIRG